MSVDEESVSEWDPQLFLWVKIPGDIQPLERGERFEDPLAAILRETSLGEVSGGGSQLTDPYPDGRARAAFCGIDIDVTERDLARALVRKTLTELRAPSGTEIHYTDGTTMLLDRLGHDGWIEHLPRSERHPGFDV